MSDPFEAFDNLGDPFGAGGLPRKRGRAGPQLDWEIVRELDERELEAIAQLPSEVITPDQLLKDISYRHHQLAQSLARGTSEAEVSLISGYSPAYISRIKNDPQFRELLAHYAAKSEAVFVDVMERMKAVGVVALDRLGQRLEDDDQSFSNRELMELTELTVVKPVAAQQKAGAVGHGPGVAISVSFVQAGPGGPTIEHRPAALREIEQ